MIRIFRVAPNDPLIAQERDLRLRALLGPIGYSVEKFEAEFPVFNRIAERFVAALERPASNAMRAPGAPAEPIAPVGAPGSIERIVVGCASLLPHHPSPGTGKLMQMAVDKQLRGQAIGRRLVAEIERRAFGELGLTSLFCHARAGEWGGRTDGDAVGFYEACGWTVEGDQFTEAGIPHRKLVVRG